MPKYLTLQEWQKRSAFGPVCVLEHIDRVDVELGLPPGTHARFLEWEGDAAEDVDNALRRRYTVPFAATSGTVDITKVPRVVKKWVWMLLDTRLLDARRAAGASDPDDSRVGGFEERATTEMAAAADAEKPHPELPLRTDSPSTSGVVLGGPMVLSFVTINGWFDAQAASRDQEGW